MPIRTLASRSFWIAIVAVAAMALVVCLTWMRPLRPAPAGALVGEPASPAGASVGQHIGEPNVIRWAAYSEPVSERLAATGAQLSLAGHTVDVGGDAARDGAVQLCQACSPAGCNPVFQGVDCRNCPPCGEANWGAWGPIPWQVFAQGEYIGPHRLQHLAEYRLRVDDRLDFVFRLTRDERSTPYKLNAGDTIRIELLADDSLNRELVVQPDQSITLPLLGQVRAGGLSVDELRGQLEQRYLRYYNEPAVTVTPVKQNTRLLDLIATVDSRAGQGGQNRMARVTPEGTIQLPGVGSVFVQGLTLDELKRELDERYAAVVEGVEVQPVLLEHAPRYVYVVGEVRTPGRFTLEGPTTAIQSIALAGGWLNGGNLRQIVIFRRTEDWQLVATKLDLRGALLGKRPCPADEIWLRDSDIVVVPPSSLKVANDIIELVFTRGAYGILPVQGVSLNFAKASTL